MLNVVGVEPKGLKCNLINVGCMVESVKVRLRPVCLVPLSLCSDPRQKMEREVGNSAFQIHSRYVVSRPARRSILVAW